jgi:two-component system sensor histidine kinase KdpD
MAKNLFSSKKTTHIFAFNIKSKWNQYLFSVIIITLSALLSKPLSNSQGYHLVSFILLFMVSILATFMGIGPVFLASALSALLWNYFFIPPNLTFHIDKAEDILMFGMFFIVALLNGIFTTRVRRQEQLAIERERRTNALFQLSRQLSGASGIDEVLAVAIEEIKSHFALEPLFILQDGNKILHQTGRLRKDRKLSPLEYQVAEWVFVNMKPAGSFTDTLTTTEQTFFPLTGSQVNPGVLAVRLGKPLQGDQKVLWDTFIAQISGALEREFLGELAQKARFLDESDRLYKTLFSSISHELRIPVATIMGASDTLLNSAHPSDIQHALMNEVFTASLRLNRLIENLLNMSRLESGLLSVRLDWHDINDLVNKVTEDLRDELRPYTLIVSVQENMPLVRIDFGLMEQVLYNLLYNATQYAPVASEIHLDIRHENSRLIMQITDSGPGFPEEDLPKVFSKFYRAEGSITGGLGLGLSIVRGFVEAHNGQITAENHSEGGARFNLFLPSENPDIDNIPFEKS